MPYIDQAERARLDREVDALAAAVRALGPDYEGRLNYAITRLVLGVLPERRYAHVARATGVLENVKQEFYRRYAAPYEDAKAAEAGDVYDA